MHAFVLAFILVALANAQIVTPKLVSDQFVPRSGGTCPVNSVMYNDTMCICISNFLAVGGSCFENCSSCIHMGLCYHGPTDIVCTKCFPPYMLFTDKCAEIRLYGICYTRSFMVVCLSCAEGYSIFQELCYKKSMSGDCAVGAVIGTVAYHVCRECFNGYTLDGFSCECLGYKSAGKCYPGNIVAGIVSTVVVVVVIIISASVSYVIIRRIPQFGKREINVLLTEKDYKSMKEELHRQKGSIENLQKIFLNKRSHKRSK